ncbi:DUF4214 domain-containing protein [Pseudomonas abietaniphila]|uniref:DUF4214 domain-containing protein n=1 Tax=Pseudomonas abietaniphila TaxID=89065 RepID=UPI000784EBF1|nr:DUF4214 domain-containing protein [Pseudomonas abietaniphila]
MAITTAQIQQLYVAYLGRAADKAGLDYWFNQLNGSTTTPATLTLENLRANFVNEQPEYTNAYAGLTRSETVSKIYLQLFGHSADAAGLEYWTTGGGATVNTDQLLVAFINGASATDSKVVANKVLVSEVYTAAAGANYTADDAKAAIANVDDTTASVTSALTTISALPGIAQPANVALVQADIAAQAAVTSYEASKVDSLKALNDKIVALNATHTANLTPITDGADTGTVAGDSYSEVAVAINNATLLRDNISGSSTDDLKTAAADAAQNLVDARATLVNTDVNAVAKINAYNAAVAADAKVAAVDATAVTNTEASFDGILGAGSNQATFDAAVTSYKTASGSTATISTSADLYAELVGAAGNSAKLAQLDTAFGANSAYSSAYSTLKTLAATDAAKQASVAKVDAAETAVGNAYVTASEASVAATKVLADAQAADALVAQATAETNAHDAVVNSAADAHTAVTGNAAIHDLDAVTPVVDGSGSPAELFYFSSIKATDDFSLTNFTKGDAIYVGTGLTFNSSVTVGTDGYAVGTNTAAKEIYFTKDATSGDVQVNIETNAVGHTAGTGNTDNVAVITLTGVTDVSQVAYANGVISTTHAA